MKKNLAIILFLALISVFAFSACDKEADCTHTFSEKWSTNADKHWHATTCGHGEIKGNEAAHVDADEDGVCDVCTYETGHIHTFSSEWSFDDEKHWKEATCSHTGEVGESAAHVDDDLNGKCDVCETHTHLLDEAGFCTACGVLTAPIDENDLPTLVKALKSRKVLINSGKLDYDVIIRSANGSLTDWYDIEYTFGSNGVYYKHFEDEIKVVAGADGYEAVKTGNKIITEKWLKLIAEEQVDGMVATSVGGVYTDAEPSAYAIEDLGGVYCAISTLANGYGPEAALDALFTLSLGSHVSNRVCENDTVENKVSLSYNILVVNDKTAEGKAADYYEVSVNFTYTDAFALTSIEIVCDCYTDSVPGEEDYTFDQDSETITMLTGALADTYTFKMTQTVGEREEIEIKDSSVFTPTDIQLVLSGSTDPVEEINVVVGDFTKELSIVCLPSGTFVKFLKGMSVKVLNEYGRVSIGGLQAYFQDGKVALTPTVAGTYKVVVTIGDISKTVIVNVENQELEGEYSLVLNAKDNNAWVGPHKFVAPQSGTYTFYCPTYGVKIWEKSLMDAYVGDGDPGPYVDYDNSLLDSKFTVELEAGETFSFYYMLFEKNIDYTIKYDID